MKKRHIFILAVSLSMFISSSALASYYDEGRDGTTEAGAYIIDSIEDIEQLSVRVNSGQEESGRYYKLATSLNISGTATWNPIGAEPNAFTGHFDGNGQTITMNITNNAYRASLFGLIGTTSGYAVKNLNVTGTINGKFAAGIASVIDYGTDTSIENCTFTGNLKSEYQYNPTDSPSDNHTSAGGIVEVIQSGTVKNCKVISTSIKANQNQSQFNISAYAGGIAATMGGGLIVSCSVKSTDIFSYGIDSYSGGIVGNSNYGAVRSCDFAGNHESMGYTGGIIGKMESGDNEAGDVNVRNNTVKTSVTSSDIITKNIWGAIVGYIVNSGGSVTYNNAEITIPEELRALISLIQSQDIGTNHNLLGIPLQIHDNYIEVSIPSRIAVDVNGKVSGGCNFGLGAAALATLAIFLRKK